MLTHPFRSQAKNMNNAFKTTILATLLTIGGSLPALAQDKATANDRTYYLALHGGYNNLDSWPATVSLGPGVSTGGNLKLDYGPHFGIATGRQTENARFELEYQQGSFDVAGIQLGPVSESASGKGHYKALTANAYRTHAFDEQWSGYAGLGIGFGSVYLPAASFSSGCHCFAAASKDGLVLLGRLGVEYRFNSRHNAALQYTWLRVPGPQSGGSPSVSYPRETIGIIGLGYRYVY